MKMQLKTSSAKWQPFCPGGDELAGTNKGSIVLKYMRAQMYASYVYNALHKHKLTATQQLHILIRLSLEWVIKFNGLSRTADSEVHIVHISRVKVISWYAVISYEIHSNISYLLLSLWPSDTIWRHTSWSTLVQVMAWQAMYHLIYLILSLALRHSKTKKTAA